MKNYPAITVLAIAMAGFATQAAADGRGHGGRGGYGGHSRGGHFSLYLGGPGMWGPGYFGPGYYGPSPYYYAPRTVIIQPEPPVYIQRAPDVAVPSQAAVAQAPATVWYYCPAPAGYYPTVQNCTQPWVNVDPRSVAPAPVQ